jgi:hypothetical protein
MITMLGPIARTIYTIIFLLLLGVCLYCGIQVQILEYQVKKANLTIVEIRQDLEGCRSMTTTLEDSNSFLKQNLQRIDAYYRQKPKPPVVFGETFNSGNLFMAVPR